nr:collagen alpha-1(I) chain-like [Equus caballus]
MAGPSGWGGALGTEAAWSQRSWPWSGRCEEVLSPLSSRTVAPRRPARLAQPPGALAEPGWGGPQFHPPAPPPPSAPPASLSGLRLRARRALRPPASRDLSRRARARQQATAGFPAGRRPDRGARRRSPPGAARRLRPGGPSRLEPPPRPRVSCHSPPGSDPVGRRRAFAPGDRRLCAASWGMGAGGVRAQCKLEMHPAPPAHRNPGIGCPASPPTATASPPPPPPPPPPSPRTATILSGGKRPSGNSQREIKTSFTLLEAVSTYIHCLISFASQAGGEGGPGSEAALLGKGVQGPGAEQSARAAHPSMVRPARVSSSLDPGGRHHPIE